VDWISEVMVDMARLDQLKLDVLLTFTCLKLQLDIFDVSFQAGDLGYRLYTARDLYGHATQ